MWQRRPSKDEIDCIVIDNGSYAIKAGFGRDDAPRAVFPTVIGHARKMDQPLPKSHFVGDEALEKRRLLDFSSPIQFGNIQNWDDMEKIWSYTFYNKLRVAPEEHPVLLSSSPVCTKASRERMTQVMFETFNTPAFSVISTAVLALVASERTTGVVASFGHDGFCCSSILDSSIFLPSISRGDIGGKDITDDLMRRLTEKGYSFTSVEEKTLVRDIKEKFGYITADFNLDMSRESREIEKTYELPDGQVIIVGQERFLSPELLFRPSIVGYSTNVSELIFDSIMKLDPGRRKDCFANIVIEGGTSLFEGLSDRLQKYLVQLAPPSMKVRVIAPPERKYSVWIGGSIVSTLSTFYEVYMLKEEYNEHGPAFIHKRCSVGEASTTEEREKIFETAENLSSFEPPPRVEKIPIPESEPLIESIRETNSVQNDSYMKQALSQGKKEWGRSKIMIVGEGRAGKTALANSILGRSYSNTDSTIGINEFTCNVGYASVGMSAEAQVWSEYKEHRLQKEYETALARIIFNQKTGKLKQTKSGASDEDLERMMERASKGYIEGEKVKLLTSSELEEMMKSSKLRPSSGRKREEEIRSGEVVNETVSNSGKRATKEMTPSVVERDAISLSKDSKDPPAEIDTSLVMRYLGEKACVESKFIISVFDFGGQSVFNVIHPFFLTRIGVYVLVFNMEWLSSGAASSVKEDCISLYDLLAEFHHNSHSE